LTTTISALPAIESQRHDGGLEQRLTLKKVPLGYGKLRKNTTANPCDAMMTRLQGTLCKPMSCNRLGRQHGL